MSGMIDEAGSDQRQARRPARSERSSRRPDRAERGSRSTLRGRARFGSCRVGWREASRIVADGEAAAGVCLSPAEGEPGTIVDHALPGSGALGCWLTQTRTSRSGRYSAHPLSATQRESD